VPSTAVPRHLRPQGKKLFSFVVVADTHINQEEDVSSSPYQTNKLANARARHVFLDIATMDPQPRFVIHLGDIVNPVPSLPTFAQAADHFKDIIKPVRVPVHVLPGNHDVGDKRIEWMPAEQVCDDFIDTYRRTFGPDYFSFVEGNTRFILINSLLLNSGLQDEARQKAWLEAELEQAAGQRVFLFMHYPPYIYARNERSNYDNLDEPGRSWLLSLMERPNVEAAFAGHVHNFWYDRVGGAELYMLPSTAFLRHDFTEFYHVAPGSEFGRGDVHKFGYFIVDLYESGHVAYSLRTLGEHAAPGAASVPARARYLAHPKVSALDTLGVELRHPWSESMQITATGGVQEFGRKWARNDYPLQALWEMGVRLAKIPEIDLADGRNPAPGLEILAPTRPPVPRHHARHAQAGAAGARFATTSGGHRLRGQSDQNRPLSAGRLAPAGRSGARRAVSVFLFQAADGRPVPTMTASNSAMWFTPASGWKNWRPTRRKSGGPCRRKPSTASPCGSLRRTT